MSKVYSRLFLGTVFSIFLASPVIAGKYPGITDGSLGADAGCAVWDFVELKIKDKRFHCSQYYPVEDEQDSVDSKAAKSHEEWLREFERKHGHRPGPSGNGGGGGRIVSPNIVDPGDPTCLGRPHECGQL